MRSAAVATAQRFAQQGVLSSGCNGASGTPPDRLKCYRLYTRNDVGMLPKYGSEYMNHLKCLCYCLFPAAVPAGRPERVCVVETWMCCLLCLVEDVVWWKGPDFMGWQKNVKRFILCCIGWRKIPSIFQPHPILPIPLKDTLQFLALVVQTLHMPCRVVT